jgi:hypothetical protein
MVDLLGNWDWLEFCNDAIPLAVGSPCFRRASFYSSETPPPSSWVKKNHIQW